MTSEQDDLEFVADVFQRFVSGTLDIGVSEALRLKSAYSRVRHHPFLMQRTLQKLVERDARVREFIYLAASVSPAAQKKAQELGLV